MSIYTRPNNVSSGAFTLIELLVVIAIIGLLSSVVLASISGARESAKVTRTTEDFRQIRTALDLWMVSNNFSAYPRADSSEVCGGTGVNTDTGQQCPLATMVGNPSSSFGRFMPTAPEPVFADATSEGFTYRWNRFNSPDCNDSPSRLYECGVTIRLLIDDVGNEKIAEALDDVIDDGDGGEAGKLRYHIYNFYDVVRIFYHLSDDHSY